MKENPSKSSSDLNAKFEQDKKGTLATIKDFLQDNSRPKNIDNEKLLKLRELVKTSIEKSQKSKDKKQVLTETIKNLEELRDLKTGISIHSADQNGVPVVIRDARKAKDPMVRDTEAFEIQYLNAIRAAIDIVENESDEIDKTKLSNELMKEAQETMKAFDNERQKKPKSRMSAFFKDKIGNKLFKRKTAQEKSQERLYKLSKNKINNLAKILEKEGIKNSYTKLNVAKDFQNFNDNHSNVVTISTIKDDNGRENTAIEAEVALKGLTESQKQEYKAIIENKDPKPEWYKKMPEWEQKLVKKYAEKIIDGKHVIPTQLRQIVGMKNAFEKTTALYNDKDKKLNILHTSKHAGTLASFAKPGEKERQRITDENAKQAKEWIGKGIKLHVNTLNSNYNLSSNQDPEIVKFTKNAMKNKEINGEITNTSFNLYRVLKKANILDGAKNSLTELQNSISTEPEFEVIKSQLNIDKKARKGNAKTEIERLRKQGSIDKETAKILRSAIRLRRSIERASLGFKEKGLDKENASLDVSRHLNILTSRISKLDKKPDCMKKIPQKEEVLRMCASGKDRTGLAEHDQSAQAIAGRLKIDIKNIDRQLLKSGHTAQQAGGVHVGGGTIGCFGTKSENNYGIPKSRKANLKLIIEKSAQSNKIKKPGKLKRFITTIKQYISSVSPDSTPKSSKTTKSRKR